MPSVNVLKGTALLVALTAGCLTLGACSKEPPVPPASPPSQPVGQTTSTPLPPAANDLSSLFSHIWRVTKAPSQPAPGSIFLANRTLLETSCTETYRIATWTIDQGSPRTLRVVEVKQMAFTANISDLTNSTLTLQKRLVRSKQTEDVTFTAVEGEYVCPDLRK